MNNQKRFLLLIFILALIGFFTACQDIDIDNDDSKNWIAVKERGFIGFVDQRGKRQIRTEFAAGRDFSEEMAGVNIGADDGDRGFPLKGKWGFINKRGEILINPVYNSPANGILPYRFRDYGKLLQDGYQFSEGLAAIQSGDSWKYISKEGDVEISYAKVAVDVDLKQHSILAARRFQNGVAAVQLKNGWGFINRKGMIIVPGKYAFAYDERDGFLMTADRDGTMHCFNKKGENIFTQRRMASPFSGGMAAVIHGFKNTAESSPANQLELMDKIGRFTASPEFDYIGACASGLCPVRVGSTPKGSLKGAKHISARKFEDGMWGYIDTTGSFRINPIFDEAKGFSQGLAPIRMGRKWGYIDRSGQFVYKPQFSFAGPFKYGFARVRIARNHEVHPGRSAWINLGGDIIWTDGTPNR